MNIITFFTKDLEFSLAHKRKTKLWILCCIQQEKKEVNSIGYIFCSDDYLLTLNEKFLKHATLTDTITFNYSSNISQIEGEVFISVERVRENATKFSVPFEEEINRVMIHGALHLCGYNDKKDKEKSIMKRKEDKYLKLFHVEQDSAINPKFHVKH